MVGAGMANGKPHEIIPLPAASDGPVTACRRSQRDAATRLFPLPPSGDVPA